MGIGNGCAKGCKMRINGRFFVPMSKTFHEDAPRMIESKNAGGMENGKRERRKNS